MTENDINIYNNGKIYTIRCRTDNDLIYVGSSIQPLHKRFHAHKTNLNKGKYNNSLLYNKMNELGINNFYIELYENYKCNSKEELNRREGEVIRDIGTLNSNITGRTPQEYRKDNKEHYKEWCEKNKIKLKEYNLEYKKRKKRTDQTTTITTFFMCVWLYYSKTRKK